MKIKTFLSETGLLFEKGLNFVLGEEPIIAPILVAYDPPIGLAYAIIDKLVYAAVLELEMKYTAMGKQSGTGAQKQKEVVSLVGPTVKYILSNNSLPASDSQVNDLIVGTVTKLNAYPAKN